MPAQVRQQLGHALRFVEDDAAFGGATVRGQKAARVGGDALAHVRVFERDVAVLGQRGGAVRASVVLPDWRGPVSTTTGKPRVRRSNRACACG